MEPAIVQEKKRAVTAGEKKFLWIGHDALTDDPPRKNLETWRKLGVVALSHRDRSAVGLLELRALFTKRIHLSEAD